MLTIINNKNLKYTKGDTFELTVSAQTDFNAGSQLKLVIVKDDYTDLITYIAELTGGKFAITLDAADKNKLDIGDYHYKLTLLTLDGKILTQQSGNLFVRWGA